MAGLISLSIMPRQSGVERHTMLKDERERLLGCRLWYLRAI